MSKSKSEINEILTNAPDIEVKNAADWQALIDRNSDPYGQGIDDYAERFARLMQIEIASGKTVAESATIWQGDADTDGISGFMYGCAIDALVEYWVHGEALRKWHNGEYGELDAVGTINPALLVISEKTSQDAKESESE